VWRSQIREGNQLIAQIDAFARSHGSVPSGLAEVGVQATAPDHFFYERCDKTHYILWFGTTLGESMTYD